MVDASALSSDVSLHAVEAGSAPRRAAQFVGRVGALAVALGVGVGVGLAPAVGLADPSGSVGGSGSDVVDASDRGARTPNFDIPVPLWAVLSATALLSVVSTLALFIYGQGSLGI